jgi:tetratricopeptide (TPR) repeat protein
MSLAAKRQERRSQRHLPEQEPMMMRLKSLGAMSLVLSAVACGGGAQTVKPPAHPSGKVGANRVPVSKMAAQQFSSALDSFVSHDKAGNWNEDSCKDVAQQFLTSAATQKSETHRTLPEAIYNAGLTYQRCDDDANAQAEFQAALAADPNFQRAQAQLALYDYQKTHDLNGTISKLEGIIRAAHFQNEEALVSVAALQMERDNDVPDSDGKNDLDRAKLNLQRALAIDDSFMPAFNELAVYYMELAKKKAGKKAGGWRHRSLVVAGAKTATVNEQQLDLAALVASQGMKKNPNYAPIYNTAGLIQVQEKNYNSAVKSFKRARELDPKFFEADMNYAAVNLGFRGFKEAEQAYRDALKLRPDTYAAHLGLALALRGQINDSNFDQYVKDAQAQLDEAKKLDPNRPETYYNEAILTQEYKAKGSQQQAVPMLEKAASLYRAFIDKAGSAPQFAEAVKRSKEREQDINDTVKFIKEGDAARKAAALQAAAAAKAAAPAPKDQKKK